MNTNTKYTASALVIIIIIGLVSYIAYSGAFTNKNLPKPTPTPTTNPTQITNPTTTTHPTTKPTTSPTDTPTITTSPTTKPIDLRIFIASSLIHVVQNMSADFEKTNNVHLIISSDSSSALYQQILAGSPCDVFMSADQKWTKQLNTSGLLYNSNYVNFTTNSLEMIIASGNPKGITSLADLTNPGVNVIFADPSIPSGSYTNTTCWKIDRTWGNPSSPAYINNGSYVNFNATVHQNVHDYPLTVEQVVGKVSLDVGTADAGIVFHSDAVWGNMTHAQVQFVPIHAEVNTRGTYGIAVVGQVQNSDPAQKFMDFWSSTQGQTLLTQFGFNS